MGCDPADATSTPAGASARAMASAIWLRAEFATHMNRMKRGSSACATAASICQGSGKMGSPPPVGVPTARALTRTKGVPMSASVTVCTATPGASRSTMDLVTSVSVGPRWSPSAWWTSMD